HSMNPPWPACTWNGARLTASSTSLGCQPRLQLRDLSGFFFRAFFQSRFSRKYYATLVVDADALDPNDIANFGNIFGPFHSEIRELGDVHKPILTRENFDKCAEFLCRDHTSLVRLPDLHFARHATDNFFRACHAFTAGCVNVHGTVVFNINFGTSLRDNTLDGLAARSDERPDLFRIDLHRLDSRRVLR